MSEEKKIDGQAEGNQDEAVAAVEEGNGGGVDIPRFKVIEDEFLTYDNYLKHNFVKATLELNEHVKVTYRTITFNETQEIEASIPLKSEESARKVANDINRISMTYCVLAVNDTNMERWSQDKKIEFFGNMGDILFDLIKEGWSEFYNQARYMIYTGKDYRLFWKSLGLSSGATK
jgi:hypothetical protein